MDNTDKPIDSEYTCEYELSQEDKEFSFYLDILNLFQIWYNKTVEPSYPSMIEDTDDPTYTNGSMETFFDFMILFKENINNLSMTRVYKLSNFLQDKQDNLYEEYYRLKIKKNGDIEEYASPLMFALLIYLSKISWTTIDWEIDIIE